MALKMQVHRQLTQRCKDGQHDVCIGRSEGDAHDPHTYECTCSCHVPKCHVTGCGKPWTHAGPCFPDAESG